MSSAHVVLKFIIFALLGSAGHSIAAEASARPRRDSFGDSLPAGALARLGTNRFRVPDGILALTLSPDGKVLALALGNGSHISLMDTNTGKVLHRYRADPDGVRRLTFSPDGKSLAAISGRGDLIVIYEAETGAIRGKIERDERFDEPDIVFSNDGKRVTAGCLTHHPNLTLKVWDSKTMKEIASCPSLHDIDVKVTLSDDGKILASWGESARGEGSEKERTIQIRNLGNGKELHRLDVGKHVFSAAFSPDGKHLAVTASYPPALLVWDLSTGRRVRQVAMEDYKVDVLRYSLDGKFLAAAGCCNLEVWETASGKRLHFHHEPRCRFTSITFRDGKVLAAGVLERSVFLWGGANGQTLTPQQGHSGQVRGIAFNRDGIKVTTLGLDGVRLWQRESGKHLRHVIVPIGSEEDGLYNDGSFLSPKGNYLVKRRGYSDPIQLADVATGKVLYEWKQFNPHSRMPAAFSADEKILALIGAMGEQKKNVLRLWNPSNGQLLRKLDLPAGDYLNAAFSPNGKTVAVQAAVIGNGRGSRRVRLWDVASGKVSCTLEGADLPTFDAQGELRAASGAEGIIRLWNRRNERLLHPLRGNQRESVYHLLFSPDGRTLAAVSSGPSSGWRPRVVLWELASGLARAEFLGHREGGVNAMVFSPDGCILATGGDDTTVLLWDVTGRDSAASLAQDKLSLHELTALWSDLDSRDARKAHRAMARLTAAPAEAISLFRKKLAPASSSPTATEIERLIADLDSDSFATRENASRRLELTGEMAESLLREALKTRPTLEKKRRLEALLEIVGSGRPAWEMVRPLRAVEVLERLATAEARQLLETISQGALDNPVTRDAKRALRRLSLQR